MECMNLTQDYIYKIKVKPGVHFIFMSFCVMTLNQDHISDVKVKLYVYDYVFWKGIILLFEMVCLLAVTAIIYILQSQEVSTPCYFAQIHWW